jgi:hypothetical protein
MHHCEVEREADRGMNQVRILMRDRARSTFSAIDAMASSIFESRSRAAASSVMSKRTAPGSFSHTDSAHR